ncbi:MAG: sigma-70 family RNA polymerase sigma factor [Bellilinea sp.]|jgi:RNA polymerase sigma-70 factor (ECF subfamily)
MTEESLNNQTISLAALKAGDRAEFARLVDATSNHIYHLALKILRDTQDAEDVLQESYIKALRALPEFEGRSSLSTWLYRIAVNEALMLLRKRKVTLVPVEEDPDEDDPVAGMVLTDWGSLPENELLSSESRERLESAIDTLPDTLRVVFMLRDMEGLSIRETADSLGLTETAVKTRLLRARLRLRNELSVYYGERMTERASDE